MPGVSIVLSIKLNYLKCLYNESYYLLNFFHTVSCENHDGTRNIPGGSLKHITKSGH